MAWEESQGPHQRHLGPHLAPESVILHLWLSQIPSAKSQLNQLCRVDGKIKREKVDDCKEKVTFQRHSD